MNTLAQLKKNSSKAFEALTKKLHEANSPSYENAENQYWKLTVDKAGNGLATIRFLPPPSGEDMPYVAYHDHAFKGPTGKWYIEKSLSTLGQPDPVAEANKLLWEQGEGSEGRKLVSGTNGNPGRKRRLHYVTNIYVVKDSGNPENEGKIFLFRFGKKIFDKLKDAMFGDLDENGNPIDPDQEVFNPFDFWTGANFKLRQRKVEGYPNFDKSEFEKNAPLFDDDKKIEEVYTQLHSLAAVIDVKNFKTYDELAKRLADVLNESARTPVSSNEAADFNTKVAEFKAPKSVAETDSPIEEATDDEAVSFFKNLGS